MSRLCVYRLTLIVFIFMTAILDAEVYRLGMAALSILMHYLVRYEGHRVAGLKALADYERWVNGRRAIIQNASESDSELL